jgi:triosephosphate isomerase
MEINWVIIGSSDRRKTFKENDDHICDKALEALEQGM